MLALTSAPFEACDLRSGQVTPTSLVRYRGNDYSVPVAFGHRVVCIKVLGGRVVIGFAAEIIADHPRSCDTGDMVFAPLHYLRLIERKIMSFGQAAPFAIRSCLTPSPRSSGCWWPDRAKRVSESTCRCYASWNILNSICCMPP